MSTFCDRCGAPVEAGAQRCLTCGWPVPVPLTAAETGRLEVDDQPTPLATQRVDPPARVPAAPVRGTEPTPYARPVSPGEVEGYQPQGYDPLAFEPQPYEPQAYEPQAYEPVEADPTPEPAPLSLHGQDDDRPGSPIAVRLLIGLAAGAVVVLVGLFVLFYGVLRSPSDPAPTVGGARPASPTASAPGAEPSAGSTAPSTAPTTPTTPSTTTAAYPAVTLSGSACGTRGSGPFANVAAGNAATSCPFALAVQAAFVAQTPKAGQAVSLTATSPVTKKPYAMSCSGTQPVRCSGGNGALVFLYGGTATFSG